MSKIDEDLKEILSFIQGWSPQVPDFSDRKQYTDIKYSYKQFHALLVWGLVVGEIKLKDEKTVQYLTECLSDVSHSYLLNLYSLYKSSRSSLRSGVENSLRVILLHKMVDISAIVTVYELFNRSRIEYKSDELALKLISGMQVSYSELCMSVHSSKLDYLSVAVPFASLSEFQEDQFSVNNNLIRSVSSSVNQIFFLIWSQSLYLAGHVNEDLVRDALPKLVKKSRAV